MAPSYHSTWQRRLWQLLDDAAVFAGDNHYAIAVLDDRSHKVFEGKTWHFSYVATDVVTTESVEVILATGAKQAIVTLSSSVGAESEYLFYEGTTTTDDGTSIILQNRDRNSIETLLSSVTHTPTISSDGTLLNRSYFPAGVKNKEVGSSSEETGFWILKPNTKYLIRVTNISGGNEEIAVSGDIYENGV